MVCRSHPRWPKSLAPDSWAAQAFPTMHFVLALLDCIRDWMVDCVFLWAVSSQYCRHIAIFLHPSAMQVGNSMHLTCIGAAVCVAIFFDSAQVEVVMQKSRRLLITIAAGRNWKTSSLLAACSCLSRALILVSLSLISDFRTCEWRILSGQGGWYLFVWCMTLKLKTILAWAIG